MKTTLFLPLLLWLGFMPWVQAQTNSFIFFDGTYEQLQTRAKSAKMPYFIYFYANWAQEAKRLNETTFSQPQFAQYAQPKFLGLRLDGESLITEGEALAKRFQVLYLPCLAIFTPEGKLLERVYGYLTPEDLTAKLKAHENKRGEPDPDAPVLYDENPEIGKNLFKVAINRIVQTGYGVQIGTFNNYKNVFQEVLRLQEEKFHKNIMLFVDETNGQSIYKIILGPFFTQEQAASYLTLLQKRDQVKGLVVDLEELNEK